MCALLATTVLKGVHSQILVHLALSWQSLGLSLRPTVKLVIRVLTVPHGLRPLLTSFAPKGGSVHQDQCLDISKDVSVHLAMRAHLVVPSPQSVALVLFNLYLDRLLVTPVHQVSTALKVHLCHLHVRLATSVHYLAGRLTVTATPAPLAPSVTAVLSQTRLDPAAQPYGDVCPMGHFCPQGSWSPKPCPAGSFLPEPGASSSSHCQLCSPGKYCHSPGASQPTGLCFAGFFCSGGADSPTPQVNSSLFSCLHKILEVYSTKTETAFWMHNMSCFDNSSNSGSDAGWTEEVTEPQADSDHIVTHSPCLKNTHYACSTYKGDTCPRGFYCPLGSTYPRLCEAGSYCNQTGLDSPAGTCPAEYYCPKGSLDPHATPCPTGHYCPLGTPLPVPCPLGTIKGSLGGSTVKACQLCPPGHYCHQRGRAEPSGQCAEGYYCPEGQSTERPQQHVCSVGHYCEKMHVSP
ncbi:uncharacterized protein LOC113134181 [Mastacembelus armatus]|uniref:uncharacterized protein LOC113134181 n=1 Tax=Mastacembelus armatus TaxID=205130 RepID=UPI001436B776|nr:uncharacterized protein LOC113134181 [Mastacembelus armatus]